MRMKLRNWDCPRLNSPDLSLGATQLVIFSDACLGGVVSSCIRELYTLVMCVICPSSGRMWSQHTILAELLAEKCLFVRSDGKGNCVDS